MYAGNPSMVIAVDAGDPMTICYGEVLELNELGATITGDVTDGIWFSSGDGVFLPGAQANGIFSTTTQYQPGLQDQSNGSFSLILVSDDPDGNGPMVEVSDEVTITFMNPPALVCNNSINVSLSEGCQQQVDVTMLLANPVAPYDKYQIELLDEDDNIIADNLLTVDQIGTNVSFIVSHDCTNGFCDGSLTVNDNIAPFLNCIDSEADCETGISPESTGFPIPFYATAISNGDNTYTVVDFDDCSDVTLSYTDIEEQLACIATGFTTQITRTWSATDEAGNNSLCEQIILVRPLALADVILPENYDGITNPPLSCDGDWIALTNGYPSPETTGEPSFAECSNIEGTYTDVYFEVCGAGFKIVRKWEIFDWCMSGNNNISHNQIINVLDIEGPVFECPEDITLNSKAYTCESVAEELIFTDVVTDCSDYVGSFKILTLDDVDVTNLYLNGNTVENLPVGAYQLINIATDECGNDTECISTITVEDTSAPFAVCDGFTKVSLGSNGVAELFATSVDDGSFDNCAIITMEIAKMTDECNWGLAFGPKVRFCCEEIGDTIMVAFRVTDQNGLSNICMVTVKVEDKLPPVVVCPSDLTVSCNFAFNLDDLSVFGEVLEGTSPAQVILIDGVNVGQYGYFNDNCGAEVEETATNDIDCGAGIITRTFTATDFYGQTNSCIQTITLVNDSPFLVTDITWPSNFEMNGCDTIQANSDITGEPTLSSEKCALVASTYEDQIFYISGGACIKILREWTVIDWCQYDPNTGEGLWTYLQEIKLKNNISPVILNCEDQEECTYDDDCQSGMITITAFANDDCTDSLNLLYLWKLDLDDDGSIDETGEGISFDRELDLGGHRVFWTVEDGCGNESFCDYMIDVRDCKNPTLYCNSSITTAIMNEAGAIDIWASDFDYGSTDNCTAPEDLIFSFSNDLNDNRRIITCDSIENGVAQVFTYNMYVTDEWGNQESCTVTFIVQDNVDWCENGTIKGKIEGKVATQKNKFIADAEIDIVASIDTFSGFEMTDEAGAFKYEETPELLKYVLRPHYNSGASEGVTTLDLVKIQRHILGLDPFDNPYDIIVADVNKNEKLNSSDLLTMRKMILGIITEWPKEIPNWRFIDSSFVFEDPEDPFYYPDSIVIQHLMDTTHAANFIAMKMGDVNGSYNPGFVTTEQDVASRSNNTIQAVISAANVQNAEVSSIIINSEDTVDGLQFSLRVGQEAIITSALLNKGDYVIQDGILRVSWLNTTNININGLPFLDIRFNDVEIILTKDLEPEIYINLEVHNINLVKRDISTEKSFVFSNLKVLGNPFSNDLNILNNSNDKKVDIEIFDAVGNLVYRKAFENQHYISIPAATFTEQGVYFLKNVQNEVEQVQKVIKI
ncbi:MAG: hypothetical protein ACJA1A_002445 [Saprospiraceae bacterium]|jgi:hypothetical protein